MITDKNIAFFKWSSLCSTVRTSGRHHLQLSQFTENIAIYVQMTVFKEMVGVIVNAIYTK